MGFTDFSLVVGTSVIAGQLIVDTSGGFLYVVEDGTGYGVALNQSLRDTDSPIFANLTLGNLQVSEITSTGFIYINNATPVLDFNNAAGNVTYLYIAYDGTEDIINASTYPLRIVSAKFNLDDNGNLTIGGNLAVEINTSYPTPSTGLLFVDNHGLIRLYNGSNWELVQDSNLSHNQNGFPVNSSGYPNPSTLSTIAFTNATRTFTITPTGASYSVYVNGIEYTFTTAQTVVITATEGFWYIYYDNTGTLTASQAVWDFSITGMVCGLYWDNTNHVASFFSDERHTIAMGWVVHKYLHETVGTRYETGLVISGYTLNHDTGDAAVEIGLTAGELHDEDLEIRPTNGTSGTPASTSNYWNQPLNKPATIPIYYQIGATNVWRKTTIANFYTYVDATNHLLYYNLNSAGTWSLSDVTSGTLYVYVDIRY